jgi:hypothetical protein
MREQLKKMNLKDNFQEQQQLDDDDDDEGEGEDEFDEEDLKVYEQFIANSQQQ